MSRNAERARATRERLVEVATPLFAEHGFDGTSTEAVLRSSGVSRGALYHHFDSKRALFDAVLESVGAEFMTRTAEEARRAFDGGPGGQADGGVADPRVVLRKACVHWLRMSQEPTVQRIMLIDAPSVVGWQRLRELDEAHGLGLLKEALREVVRAGGLEPQLVDMFAHILLASLCEVALIVARAGGRGEALESGELAVDELLRRLFD